MFQQQLHHFHPVLLAGDVKRGETVLQTEGQHLYDELNVSFSFKIPFIQLVHLSKSLTSSFYYIHR